MRHYILTRSAYAPDVPLETNRKRLDLTARVLAPSLAAQTTRDATWVVMVDAQDPLHGERVAALRSSGLPVILADPGDVVRNGPHDLPWGPWAKNIDWSASVLTTRIDDDDAFAPWVLALYRKKAEEWESLVRHKRVKPRIVLILPNGWRVANGRVNERTDQVSQFSSLYAPRGDRATIMDINHTRARKLGRLSIASTEPGWLWIRHEATRSAHSRASMLDRELMVPVPARAREAFPVDWALIEGLA